MRVIGTAGHVDHGKSTLIAALTGIHPDRLKEEQEREMTIDLGFAWLTLPDGEEVGIVDVPGHRDFIENMLAGIGGIDAALLVIAADEGVMPQTREHLAILDILQVHAGMVVLTKTDLIDDPEWLDLLEEDIRKTLQGTVLNEVPILRVSSRTKAGFPQFLETLTKILSVCPPRPDLNRPRLPIDRVFSIAGFGTITTGTLSDGKMKVGEEIEILPSRLKGRIRGLQTHKKKEDTAIPGSRTAINISGINAEEIRRGQVVTHSRQYQATQRVDVHFRLLPDATGKLHHASEVKVFIGTTETIARVRLLGTEALDPGQEGWLQLELRQPIVAVRGDRYILRQPSPGETLGGGFIVDPHPKRRHKRFDANIIESLEAMAIGSPLDVLLQASLALGPAPVKDIVQKARLDSGQAHRALDEAIETGRLATLEDGVLSPSSDILAAALESWLALKDQIESTVDAYHKSYPLRSGMPREELKSRTRLQPRIFNAAIKKLVAEGLLTERGSWVARPGHEIRFDSAQQAKVQALLRKFAQQPYATPSVKECQAEVGEDVLAALVERAELIPVSTEVIFRKQDYDAMVKLVRQAIQQNGQVTLAEVRDQFGTTRKYVQAFLEHLDATGITMRQGDFRKLR